MTERELLIVSLLLQYQHVQPYASATLDQIYEYGKMYRTVRQKSDLSISEATLRRALPKLTEKLLIAEGTRNGQKKTYYVTEDGIQLLRNRAELKQQHRAILAEREQELEMKLSELQMNQTASATNATDDSVDTVVKLTKK